MKHETLLTLDITRGEDGQHFAALTYPNGTREIVSIAESEAKAQTAGTWWWFGGIKAKAAKS